MNAEQIKNLQHKNEIRMVVNETLMQTGMTSGEITYAKAAKVYGEWFRRAVASGKLMPCRVGEGNLVKKWFAITDILTLKNQEYEMAIVVLTKQ